MRETDRNQCSFSSRDREAGRHHYFTRLFRRLLTRVGEFCIYIMARAAVRGETEARTRALELEAALSVLSSFDEGPDLVLSFKHMMTLKGDAGYSRWFNETDVLSESQRGHCEAQLNLFDTWYADRSRLSGAVAAHRPFSTARRNAA